MIYLDNCATTQTYDSIAKNIEKILKMEFGNPSSLHKLGIRSEKIIKDARKNIANILGVEAKEIYFNSGGTEANNTAILGTLKNNKKNHIITTSIEHPSVLNTMKYLEGRGYEVDYINVDKNGIVNLSEIENKINENTLLVSIMAVNNEVGTIQPLNKIGEICKKNSESIFHVDGVQAFGKIDFMNEHIDLMSFSGHKIHAIKGSGGLFIKNNIRLKPILLGGGQENAMRPGTENVIGIYSMSEALNYLNENYKKNIKHVSDCRSYLIEGIKSEINDIRVNGCEDDCLKNGCSSPYILNVSFLGTKSEIILHYLEQDEIFVSVGSACSSKKSGKSHVLKSMGLDDKIIESSIRFSFSEFNDIKELDFVIAKLKKYINKVRKVNN